MKFKTKDEIQQHAVELSRDYSRLLLEFPTGLGKTLAAIKIIEDKGGLWNIVVAETTHIQNWIDDFNKHNKGHLLKNVTFLCYQSLHKHINKNSYVFDEVHHVFSDLRAKHLQDIETVYPEMIVMLSATLTLGQKIALNGIFGYYNTFKITMSEAIDEGLLPEPTIYFVECFLDQTQRIHKFHFNKEKYVMCTEFEMNKRMSDRVDYLKEQYMLTRNDGAKKRWLNYANTRKKFLSSCKTKFARMLLRKLHGKRLICFTGSIEQSEELSNGHSIHSKLSKKRVQELIDLFNNGEISEIYATGMLKEGVNLNNIEVGINTTLDNNEKNYIQINGRVMRSLLPEMYILYIKDTQDQKYVETVIENFNKDYIKFVKIEDIIR